MIDTRPLWERALSKRGHTPRRRLLCRVFMESTRSLTTNQFVDLVRALTGRPPLHAAMGGAGDAAGLYLSLEALCQRADADCARCGGSGYFDGELLDMRCPCTGLKQRNTRPKKPRVGDASFAYRKQA